MASQIVATEAALAAIERLTARHGKLMLFQSGGCSDGSFPICLFEGELTLGPSDLLLDKFRGVPFYVDAEQYERWGRPRLVLDVALGPPDGFSLDGLEGAHFLTRVARPDACELVLAAAVDLLRRRQLQARPAEGRSGRARAPLAR